ncbi:Peroxisome biosynthesis protein pex1 [Coemansia sp. Benny D115]|nr:Peroxisome biosynthesis protein pex1 [Coemansia sp. Benny D115]
MSQNLVVAFKPLHSCLVNLPRRWALALSSQPTNNGCMVFKMTWGQGQDSSASANTSGRSAVVAWSGGESQTESKRDRSGALNESVLEIDSAYGQRLGLLDGTTVGVEYIPKVDVCTAAEVEPLGFDDWEILELNAGVVEERLLQQARVIAIDQPFLFWLNASTFVTLVPSSIVPSASVALLDNDTEVAVAPKVRNQKRAPVQGDDSQQQPNGAGRAPSCCLRVAADASVDPGVVYVNPQSAIAQTGSNGNGCCVVRIGHGTQSSEEDADAEWLAPWIAQIATDAGVQPGVLLAAPETMSSAGYHIGEVVRVSAVSMPAEEPVSLEIQGDGDVETVRSALFAALGDRAQIIMNVGAWVPGAVAQIVSYSTGSGSGDDLAEPKTSREMPLRFTKASIEGLEIRVENSSVPVGRLLLSDDEPEELAGIEEFLTQAWQSVEGALLGRGAGLLICGRRGSGKTSVARALTQIATRKQRNRLVYCRRIDCAALALEPHTSTVRDTLRRIVEVSRASAPALLVFDDIDALLPAENENEQGGARRVRTLVDALDALLGLQQDGSRVAVLATAAGRAQVHPRLFAGGIFGDVLELPAPNKAAREAVFAAIAKRSATPASTGFALAAYRTEGFLPGDLHAAYERAAQEATMRVLEQEQELGEGDEQLEIAVTSGDLVRALADFKPLAMRNIKTQASTTRWSDIGGLEDTRRQLRETLELPTKYAAVFASSPLRLRSGVLLYGFPGCGKTLLASAVARECGLNFIATKGPELLSKYIGSSEQAVRDLFARAVAAAPCVLFFDEFDAIAPRRGHDNTGVTDRVVNQFLTEMDGAEGLRGVYVLAATSRPDLIDPALLRPGRLDKAFLCPMPDTSDRAAILERHAAKLRVDPAADWSSVAARTERFTGADLQALVYNAFLEAVHERVDLSKQSRQNGGDDGDETAAGSRLAEFVMLAEEEAKPLSAVEKSQLAERLYRLAVSRKDGGGQGGMSGGSGSVAAADVDPDSLVPVVSMAHFETALAQTQSSLADKDRERFAAIYREFVDDKKGSDGPKKPIEQRATMA